MHLEATRTAQDATKQAPTQEGSRCPDCDSVRPIYRVSCPGCLADLVREQDEADWAYALDGIMSAHGHAIAFQVRRRLGMR